ncbi:spermatogenesis-defective protein 39-like protein, partial [Leptotrombidium deliense]
APVAGASVTSEVTTSVPFSEQTAVVNIKDERTDFKVVDEREAEKQLQKCLKLSSSVKTTSKALTPQAAVIELVAGNDCSLYHFKSRHEKVTLLDTAISIGDGSALVTVINFLRQTLSKRIFNYEISKRPIAINHLISNLKNTEQINEAVDFLTFLGLNNEIAHIKLSQCLKTKSIDAKIRQLKHCNSNYFQGIDNELAFWGNFVNAHIDLLELQQPIENEDSRQELLPECNQKFIQIPRHSILNSSVIETLFYCCLYHYELSENNFASPKSICNRHSLNEKQFVWTALRSLCLANKWPDIDGLFQYKSWLGSRKLKSPIPMKKVVKLLHKHEAPVELIEKYLKQVEESETRMNLAMSFKMHRFVVELCANLRDRNTLQTYISKLRPQSEEYLMAQNYLRNSSIKWKN